MTEPRKLNNFLLFQGATKALRMDILVRYLCLALPEVNYQLIKQFHLGEGLNNVVSSVQQLIGPAVSILQGRVNAGHPHSSAEHTLETVREEWCALVADMRSDCSTAINEILIIILETDVSHQSTGSGRVSKNGEFVNQNADLRLNQKYSELVTKIQLELSSERMQAVEATK